MIKRAALGSAALVALHIGPLATLSGCRASEPAPERTAPERIVFVVIDTLRRDHVSAYGDASEAETPHIDALASRGVLIKRAVSSYHMTSMSMASLFTGLVPSIDGPDASRPLQWTSRNWCGLARFAEGPNDSCVPRGVRTLGEEMRAAGYRTLGIASNPLLHRPAGFDRGFDEWIDLNPVERLQPTGRARSLAMKRRASDQVLKALDDLLARRGSDRFFLYIHFMDAHDYIDGEALTEWPGLYRDAVRRADAAVGQLVVRLERESLLDGTTIVLTSDHGEYMGEQHPVPSTLGHRGNPSFEYLLRVPLIVAPAPSPEVVSAAALVRGYDTFDLLLALAGVPRTVSPGLEDDAVYLSEREFQTYRRGRWKIMRSRRDGRVLLFDIEADAGETRDRSGQDPEVVARLEAELDAIASRLATTRTVPTPHDPTRSDEAQLDDRDRARLQALGYAD